MYALLNNRHILYQKKRNYCVIIAKYIAIINTRISMTKEIKRGFNLNKLFNE
jgi:ribosomal protein S26